MIYGCCAGVRSGSRPSTPVWFSPLQLLALWLLLLCCHQIPFSHDIEFFLFPTVGIGTCLWVRRNAAATGWLTCKWGYSCTCRACKPLFWVVVFIEMPEVELSERANVATRVNISLVSLVLSSLVDYLLTSPLILLHPHHSAPLPPTAGRRVERRENQFTCNKSRADYLIRSGHNSPVPSGSSRTITRAMNHRRHGGKTAASVCSSDKSESTSSAAVIQWEGCFSPAIQSRYLNILVVTACDAGAAFIRFTWNDWFERYSFFLIFWFQLDLCHSERTCVITGSQADAAAGVESRKLLVFHFFSFSNEHFHAFSFTAALSLPVTATVKSLLLLSAGQLFSID